MKKRLIPILLFSICLSLNTGCTPRSVEKQPVQQSVSKWAWSIPNYADFVASNLKNINQLYAEEYGPYLFIADTANGSTVVQNLVDIKIAEQQLENMSFGPLNDREKIMHLHEYVLGSYRYVVEPKEWPTIQETIQWGKGDCKGLSLLLMSLLLASGFETHAAVSNGHMWVNVKMDGKWHVLEMDRNPDRARIYQIPGFYDRPLFKIYQDGTEKRIRKQK